MDSPKFTSEDILQGLPPTTPELIASDVRSIKAALCKLGLEEEPEYVIFSCVPPSAIDEMVERPRLWGGVCMRTFYSADSRKLIIKLPKRPHEIVSRGFEYLIREEAKRQGVRHDLTSIGSETIREQPYAKEADSAWIPRRQVPGRSDKWPTLVLEVGLSETLARLHIDMKWWFSNSGGQVKIVIIASIHRNEPQIVVEKWELQRRRPHSHNLRSLRAIPREGAEQNNHGDGDDQDPEVPTLVQEITLNLQPSTNTITTTGGPLVIPFHKLLLKNRAPYSVQADFTYTAATLKKKLQRKLGRPKAFCPGRCDLLETPE